MSPSCAKPPEQGPPFPHLRIAFASRTGAVKAASWAPEGSLDGWTRCRIISHEGMAGTWWLPPGGDISTLLKATFLLCSVRGPVPTRAHRAHTRPPTHNGH